MYKTCVLIRSPSSQPPSALALSFSFLPSLSLSLSPRDGLKYLLRTNEELDFHLQDRPRLRGNLFVQRVAQVHPQGLGILVREPQTEVVLLYDAERLANLCAWSGEFTLHSLSKQIDRRLVNAQSKQSRKTRFLASSCANDRVNDPTAMLFCNFNKSLTFPSLSNSYLSIPTRARTLSRHSMPLAFLDSTTSCSTESSRLTTYVLVLGTFTAGLQDISAPGLPHNSSNKIFKKQLDR